MAIDPNHTNGGVPSSSGAPNSTRPLRVIAPAPPAPPSHHHIYTVPIRAQSSPVPVPVGYRPPPPLNFHPHLQPQPHYPLHYNLHHQSPPPPSKTLPFPSTTPQAAAAVTAPASSLPDSDGYKDIRDKSRDDTLSIVQDRKVRITDGASLYALCRSWLRNGTAEGSQTQYGDATRSLPKPSPIPIASVTSPKKEEGDKTKDIEDEDKESVEHVLPEDLLKRHVKRARKVRARLREERLRRIARYKSRLALLLPPLVEQFRNDLAAGN